MAYKLEIIEEIRDGWKWIALFCQGEKKMPLAESTPVYPTKAQARKAFIRFKDKIHLVE